MSRQIGQLFDLIGRNARFSGGSGGLGLQVAETLAQAGAWVMSTRGKEEDLATAAEKSTHRTLHADWSAGDAALPAAIEPLSQTVIKRLRVIDIRIDDAGATLRTLVGQHNISQVIPVVGGLSAVVGD